MSLILPMRTLFILFKNLPQLLHLNIISSYLIFKNILFLIIYICVDLYREAHEYSAYRGQKRVQDILDLKLWAVVSCPMWVLGTQLTLNYWAISPVL